MPKRLRLDAMHERHPGLTAAVASGYEEAASVCLSRHHEPPTELTLTLGDDSQGADVDWDVPSEKVRAAWANSTDTTEAGAYACVLAGLEELRGLVAVRRAETGTGADYYVGLPGDGDFDLEDCIRLEVSGLDLGSLREVTQRLGQKVRQASEGRSALPAIAGVIGFAAKRIAFQAVEETR